MSYSCVIFWQYSVANLSSTWIIMVEAYMMSAESHVTLTSLASVVHNVDDQHEYRDCYT